MEKQEYSEVTERFLSYVVIDTQSEPDVNKSPSTEKQKDLGRLLVEQLIQMGASQVKMDESGNVYAVIPSNIKQEDSIPAIGFIAHMDTAPAVSGRNVKPRIVKEYDGKDIVLTRGTSEKEYILRVSDFPEIANYIGQDLIVTDGTTLLGADDKAGVAEIMTMAHILLIHPEIEHGNVAIAFTTDEEVGQGTDFFDLEGFGADFAYTVDGGAIGELEYENFNAASAKVTIQGVSVHPGTAKRQMKNAVLMGMEFQRMLPEFENPAYTEQYEGFYHLEQMNGCTDQVTMEYIIRDHDRDKFEEKKKYFLNVGRYLNQKYGEGTFVIEMKDSYYNMKEKILPHMHLIDNAKKAMELCDVSPIVVPIRGGTDGARLSYMGLPCPNLCTGGHNFHGRYEYIPIPSMEKMAEILLKLVEIYRMEHV